MYAVHCVRKGGAEYNLYALTLGDLKDRLNAKASQALNKRQSVYGDGCLYDCGKKRKSAGNHE